MLGYFSRNVEEVYNMAKKFEEETKVDFKTICIDEILSSRRFKNMYIMFSTEDNQKNISKVREMENVYSWFRD